MNAAKRLWRLKFKASKQEKKQMRIDTYNNGNISDSDAAYYEDQASALSEQILTTSMHKIVHARLRNINKRNTQILLIHQSKQITENYPT